MSQMPSKMISHVLGRKKKPKFWPKKIPKITKKKKSGILPEG